MHTTTFSEMIPLPEGGYLIDTPGIKGFGTIEMETAEISHYSITVAIVMNRAVLFCKRLKITISASPAIRVISVSWKIKKKANIGKSIKRPGGSSL